jgi:tetratricopeptide (TPR) repeat protein
LGNQEKTAEAIKHYGQAVRFDPQHAMAYNNLGHALATQGNLDEAIRHYQRALEINPRYTRAHANWGIALTAQGKFDEAIRHYQQNLRIDPTDAEVHNDWGNTLTAQGKLDEAIRHYQEVLRMDPANANAHINWGSRLVALGQLEGAVQHFQEALRLRPNYAPGHLNLSSALAEQGQWDKAMGHFREALALDPSCALYHRNLAAALLAQGKLDEAIAGQLGQLLVREGRHSEAEPYLREALRFEATNAVVRAFLATTLHQQGKTDEALRQFEECVRLDPDRPEPLHNIAWIRATHPDVTFRNGSEAVRVAERACQLTDRKNPFFLDCLAAAYAETGRWTDAVSTAREAASVATKEGLTGLAAQIERRVALYQAKRPFRQPPGSA